jgi:hypothetical protein
MVAMLSAVRRANVAGSWKRSARPVYGVSLQLKTKWGENEPMLVAYSGFIVNAPTKENIIHTVRFLYYR